MKKFAVLLAAIFLSAGSAQARTPFSSSLSHAHFATCSEGLVKQTCVCRRAGGGSGRPQLCRSGWYCHTFDGVCRQ
jgi:hypothetical protein